MRAELASLNRYPFQAAPEPTCASTSILLLLRRRDIPSVEFGRTVDCCASCMFRIVKDSSAEGWSTWFAGK